MWCACEHPISVIPELNLKLTQYYNVHILDVGVLLKISLPESILMWLSKLVALKILHLLHQKLQVLAS